jgi:hypothetical protein
MAVWRVENENVTEVHNSKGQWADVCPGCNKVDGFQPKTLSDTFVEVEFTIYFECDSCGRHYKLVAVAKGGFTEIT